MLLVDTIDRVDIGLARSTLGLLSRRWAYWIDIGPTASTLGLLCQRWACHVDVLGQGEGAQVGQVLRHC